MTAALNKHTEIVVAGTVENQGQFYDRFDHVVLLSAPLSVIIRRVMLRTENTYGRTAAQRAEIEENLLLVEPLLRRGATMEIDARRSMGADRWARWSGRSSACWQVSTLHVKREAASSGRSLPPSAHRVAALRGGRRTRRPE